MGAWTHAAPVPLAARRLLDAPLVLKVVQNGLFDIPRLIKAGIPVRGPLWDTMLAAQIDDPDAPGYSLNELASFYLDCRRWKHKGSPGSRPKMPKIKTWKRQFVCAACSAGALSGAGVKDTRRCTSCVELDWGRAFAAWKELGAGYNRADAEVLIPIAVAQRQRLRRAGTFHVAESMMRVLEEVLIPLEMRGLRVDPARRAEVNAHFAQLASSSRRDWDALTGGAVNPSSVPQVKELLYGRWGLPLQFDKEERISVGLEALNVLKDTLQSEVADPEDQEKVRAIEALISYKQAAHYLSSYISIGDRIYPHYSPATKDSYRGKEKAIASTGRILAKGGNNPDGTKTGPLQQFPNELRALIIPEEGFLFVHADYKQQELRTIATLSRCRWLLDRLDRKPDVFDDIGTALQCDRTRAKNVFYGTWAYGGSPEAGMRALRAKGFMVREEEVAEWQALGRHLCPELARWHSKILYEAAANGKLTNPFGRVRYFRDIKRGSDGVFRGRQKPKALNYPIQSIGADIQRLILIPMARAAEKRGGFLSILMHDGFDCQVPRAEVEEFVPALRAVLEREWPEIAPGFRIPVEMATGSNWRDLTPCNL